MNRVFANDEAGRKKCTLRVTSCADALLKAQAARAVAARRVKRERIVMDVSL